MKRCKEMVSSVNCSDRGLMDLLCGVALWIELEFATCLEMNFLVTLFMYGCIN